MRVVVGMALLLSGVAALAQWGAGGCPPVGGPVRVVPAVYAQAPPAAEWRQGPDPDQVQLFSYGRQVGTWRYDTQRYHELRGDGWSAGYLEIPEGAPPPPRRTSTKKGEPDLPRPAARKAAGCGCGADCCGCPEPCPCRETARPCCPGCRCATVEALPDAAPHNFGIDLAGWRAEPREELVGGPGLPDDARRLRLTIIGTEAERKQVLDGLGDLAGRLAVQSYPPGHWSLKPGFKQDGHPTIYVQAPDGKVLHRQDDYQGGAQRLAEAIRKADPNYKPDKDPDLSRSPLLPALPAWASSPLVILGGAALLVYVATRRPPA